jgi:hypothetical protein
MELLVAHFEHFRHSKEKNRNSRWSSVVCNGWNDGKRLDKIAWRMMTTNKQKNNVVKQNVRRVEWRQLMT